MGFLLISCTYYSRKCEKKDPLKLNHLIITPIYRPSSSVDKLSEHADNEYYYAEKVGQSGAGCDRVFKECRLSLLQHFSELHHNLDKILF